MPYPSNEVRVVEGGEVELMSEGYGYVRTLPYPSNEVRAVLTWEFVLMNVGFLYVRTMWRWIRRKAKTEGEKVDCDSLPHRFAEPPRQMGPLAVSSLYRRFCKLNSIFERLALSKPPTIKGGMGGRLF